MDCYPVFILPVMTSVFTRLSLCIAFLLKMSKGLMPTQHFLLLLHNMTNRGGLLLWSSHRKRSVFVTEVVNPETNILSWFMRTSQTQFWPVALTLTDEMLKPCHQKTSHSLWRHHDFCVCCSFTDRSSRWLGSLLCSATRTNVSEREFGLTKDTEKNKSARWENQSRSVDVSSGTRWETRGITLQTRLNFKVVFPTKQVQQRRKRFKQHRFTICRKLNEAIKNQPNIRNQVFCS